MHVARGLEPALDFIHFFASCTQALEAEFPRLRDVLSRDGMLWVSWPKCALKVETDLSEGVVRDVGLGQGIVDVKICAVDRIWSGLKFVRRLRDRG